MAESSKYDIFMDELNSLEKEIYLFVQKSQEIMEANKKLDKKVDQLEKENEVLKLKVGEIESKLNSASFIEKNIFEDGSTNWEDSESLKSKISELISKIDYHLRS